MKIKKATSFLIRSFTLSTRDVRNKLRDYRHCVSFVLILLYDFSTFHLQQLDLPIRSVHIPIAVFVQW